MTGARRGRCGPNTTQRRPAGVPAGRLFLRAEGAGILRAVKCRHVSPGRAAGAFYLALALAHARWQAFTSSTMGMTHTASPSATAYSARLMCVKPKASEMPGR